MQDTAPNIKNLSFHLWIKEKSPLENGETVVLWRWNTMVGIVQAQNLSCDLCIKKIRPFENRETVVSLKVKDHGWHCSSPDFPILMHEREAQRNYSNVQSRSHSWWPVDDEILKRQCRGSTICGGCWICQTSQAHV